MTLQGVKSVIALLLSALALLVKAQPPIQHIEIIDETKGLSSNEITSIAQDKNGFLWIATLHGLNRYDGADIKQYFADGRKNSLLSNTILNIIPWDSTHLLLATSKGICILNVENYTFKKLSLTKSPQEENNELGEYIVLIRKDENGNLWVATLLNLYRFDSKLQLKKVFYSGLTPKDVSEKAKTFIYKIMPTSDGGVLVWTPKKLLVWQPESQDSLLELSSLADKNYHFMIGNYHKRYFRIGGHYLADIDYNKGILKIIDETSGQIASCLLPKEFQKKEESLSEIVLLKNGWIAICFENIGLVWVHLEQKDKMLSITSDKVIHFAGSTIYKVLEDNEGNLWIGDLHKGLYKIAYKKQHFKKTELTNTHHKLPSPFEVASFYLAEKTLWVSSYGDGVYGWDEATGKYKHFSVKSHSQWSDYVWNVRTHQKDTLWVGTQVGLIWLNTTNGHFGRLLQKHPKVLDSVAITTQYIDSKGIVWMGLGRGNGLCSYDTHSGEFKTFPFRNGSYPYISPVAVAEARNHDLYFTSPSSGNLVHWIRKESRFQIISFPQFTNAANANRGSLYIDAEKNILWYGVNAAGLVRYDLNNGSLKVFGTEKGLRSDYINGIVMDKQRKIWLSTNLGLSFFDPVTEHFVNYRSSDGLPTTTLPSKLLFDSLADRIYAGGVGTMASFSPADFGKKNTISPRITEIEINNQTILIPESRQLTLPHGRNNINISFTGVNLTNGEENRYAYRLHDNEKWIEIGNQRQIRFAELSPGTYHFAVQVAAKGGAWSVLTDSLAITIRKPYYATLWFYLLIGLGSFLLTYSFYRYRLSQLRQTQKMRSQISHDLHDEIGSRLTIITMMSHILESRKMSAHQQEQWLDKIQNESEQISQNLREIVWNINPSNDSLEEAMPRMLKFAADILEAKGITVQTKIPELKKVYLNMQQRRNLFFIFKEAIQNILKHADAKNVFINVSIENNIFKIEIRDDGKGFEMNERFISNGLSYMHQRAAQFKWDLKIESKPKQGAHIYLEIKIT